jgi:hypothetical protein
MSVKSFLLSFFSCFFLLSTAQVGLVDECAYFFTLKPMLGSLSTTTDITQGINKQYDVQSKGLYYGADLLNASWTLCRRSLFSASNSGASTHTLYAKQMICIYLTKQQCLIL